MMGAVWGHRLWKRQPGWGTGEMAMPVVAVTPQEVSRGWGSGGPPTQPASCRTRMVLCVTQRRLGWVARGSPFSLALFELVTTESLPPETPRYLEQDCVQHFNHSSSRGGPLSEGICHVAGTISAYPLGLLAKRNSGNELPRQCHLSKSAHSFLFFRKSKKEKKYPF